ncbi:hypothetical protein RND81_14G025400 [Saponaria officinalis]|uniref:CAAX prenyl protease 2/Lysostaphin resistance protein A-like domain-containing protein n=1 Tax=Saponaria officinalis TaxID=3572 RepID=A0AAW1GHG0_SAPOF
MAVLCQSLATKHNPSHNKITLLSFITPKPHLHPSKSIHFKPQHNSFKLHCSNDEQPSQQIFEGFSLLGSDPPWESGNVWSTMGFYFFSLHVPFSFGGLSLVSHLFHQPVLQPQLKAVAILVISTTELFATVLLLQFTAMPNSKPVSFLERGSVRSKRNWVFAALIGFAVLVAAMYLTSLLADTLFENEGVNNQDVKEILLSGSVAQASITLVFCVIAPVLEEIVYRRFLLTSLIPSMQWRQALIVSSLIFAAAHLSGENFIQLFLIGMVLGCSYSWTGDLRSPILLHSMYNALTLFIDFNA